MPAREPLLDLAHELWAMAQGPQPIAEATARMAARIEEEGPYIWPEHIARQHPLAGERKMIRRAWRDKEMP